MKIDSDNMIPISKVNQNFSDAIKSTEEHGIITIMKNNQPKYVLMTFEKYKECQTDTDPNTEGATAPEQL